MKERKGGSVLVHGSHGNEKSCIVTQEFGSKLGTRGLLIQTVVVRA